MNDVVMLALVTASVIIVIGFLASYLFERTGLPDMLFLIVLGVIFGPILHFFDPASIIGLAPYIAALALVYILFDGGLRMNIYYIFSETPRAGLLAMIGFVLSATTIALFTHYSMGVPWLYGVLFGSICGGSSSIVVVSLATRMKMGEKCATTIVLESSITDILCIVISLAVIGIILTGQADYGIVGREITTQFSTGAVIGVLFGVLWLSILPRVTREAYAYMLTLAIVLMAYCVSEYLGGSGALSSLLFGVVLGNEREIFKIVERERTRDALIDEGMRRFGSEIAFLIRTFFFVYLGLIATVTNIALLILGIILSFTLLFVRYAAVALATIRSPFTRHERSIMSIVLTRGLAAAVLSTLPKQYGLLYEDLYINITLVIIITTAVICTIGAFVLSRSRSKGT
ncbi:MAG: potassium/proton antiporter [Candidatus Bathyarchaeota archaeon BA1]|nr:MAG: potassium/proton antiporter [Candidatus Bathyarchaeota archaeon BA1]